MSSLTTEIQVRNYLAKRRQKGFLIRGITPTTRNRKFSLSPIRTGKWKLSGNDSSGERLRKHVDALGLEEAIEEAERVLYGRGSCKPSEDLIVSDCFEKWLATLCVGEDARSNYSDCIGYFLDWCDTQGLRNWTDLRLEHLEMYASGLAEQDKKPRTIKLYTQPVRTASRWASQNWPERFKNFAAGFRLPKPKSEFRFCDQDEKNFLPLEGVAEFLLWFRERPRGRNAIPGIALQGFCGLRVREAFRLRWENVDLEEATVTIEGQVKNFYSVRRLPIPQMVVDILAESKRRSPFVVVGFNTAVNYAEAVKNGLKRWKPDFKLEPRGLRRTLPSVGIREGWHNYALERYLGHSPKTITEKHYVVQTREQMDQLLREQIVCRVDSTLKPFEKKWQQNGKLQKPNSDQHSGLNQEG